MSDTTNRNYDLVEGYFELTLGGIMLFQVIYTYCKIYGFRNLSFMNRLLFFILLISFTCIYAGIVLTSTSPGNWTTMRGILYSNTIINIIYEISSAMVIWIVGFKFIDSATKLEMIEAHFEKK